MANKPDKGKHKEETKAAEEETHDEAIHKEVIKGEGIKESKIATQGSKAIQEEECPLEVKHDTKAKEATTEATHHEEAHPMEEDNPIVEG